LIPAGYHEAIGVAGDDRDLVHAQATGQRGSEPRQRYVERRLVGQGALDGD